MWSMDRFENSTATRCTDGHNLYKINRTRGRCLTVHANNTSGAFEIKGDPLYNSVPKYTFENVNPTLVKSNWKVLGADVWKKPKAFVCPGEHLGMHRKGC